MQTCEICGAPKVYSQIKCSGCMSKPNPIPSPDEIRLKTAEIRANWPEARWRKEAGVERIEFDVAMHNPGLGFHRKPTSSQLNQ